MIYEMKLQSIYFEKIKSGEKIYEVRLNDEKRSKIIVGDIIIFKNLNDMTEKMQTLIEDIIYFDSFEEMTKTLPADKLGFKGKKVKEILNIYQQIYPSENEKEYGVVVFRIHLL